uniref:Uncharacterized protein n=1 Tax=Rhizophora mucronata TaxID=61149 RepID=A0A2P2PMZ3_RHIMU
MANKLMKSHTHPHPHKCAYGSCIAELIIEMSDEQFILLEFFLTTFSWSIVKET